jgi:hypothetical protein
VLKKLKKNKKKELSFYLHCSRGKNLYILIPYVFKIYISIIKLYLYYISVSISWGMRERAIKKERRESFWSTLYWPQKNIDHGVNEFILKRRVHWKWFDPLIMLKKIVQNSKSLFNLGFLVWLKCVCVENRVIEVFKIFFW